MSSGDQPPAPEPHSTLFVVAHSRQIVPKERRIERLQSGYSVREFRDEAEGRYWSVVTALEVV